MDYYTYVCGVVDFGTIPRARRLSKLYRDYLGSLVGYLESFYERTQPLAQLSKQYDKVSEECCRACVRFACGLFYRLDQFHIRRSAVGAAERHVGWASPRSPALSALCRRLAQCLPACKSCVQLEKEFSEQWQAGVVAGWEDRGEGEQGDSAASGALDLDAFDSADELEMLGACPASVSAGAGYAKMRNARLCWVSPSLGRPASCLKLLARGGAVGAERVKEALQALGLKCGGTLRQRAERLMLTKGKRLEELDKSLFAKGTLPAVWARCLQEALHVALHVANMPSKEHGNGRLGPMPPHTSRSTRLLAPLRCLLLLQATKSAAKQEQRVAAARTVALLEAKARRLCDMLSSVIEDTKGRIEKKQAQTYEELVAEQQEAEEVGWGPGSRGVTRRLGAGCRRVQSSVVGSARRPSFHAGLPPDGRCCDCCLDVQEAAVVEDSEEEDEFVYNPLKLPLGWDGKPIPYWLYKLHGLNLEFKCEICGECCMRRSLGE